MIVVSCQSRNQFLWYCDWKNLVPDTEAVDIIDGFGAYDAADWVPIEPEEYVVLPGGRDNAQTRRYIRHE